MTPSLGSVSAFSASATWAYGSASYTRLSKTHSAFSVNVTRAAVAFPLFLAASFVAAGGWGRALSEFGAIGRAQWAWLALSMVTSYGLGDVLFLLGARRIGITTALAVASTYPLWTAVAGVVFRGEALSLGRLIGLAATVAGVIAVILFSPLREDVRVPIRDRTAFLPGLGFAALTSLSWSLNSYSVAQGALDVPTNAANAIRMGMALIFAFALAGPMRRLDAREPGAPTPPLVVPWPALRGVLWVFVLESFIGSFLFTYGLSHSPLAVGATLSSLAPVLSVPAAWALGLERVSWQRTGAIAVVVVGLSFLIGWP